MFDPRVRALCAQITLESNQEKLQALIIELAALMGIKQPAESEYGTPSTAFLHDRSKKLHPLN